MMQQMLSLYSTDQGHWNFEYVERSANDQVWECKELKMRSEYCIDELMLIQNNYMYIYVCVCVIRPNVRALFESGD